MSTDEIILDYLIDDVVVCKISDGMLVCASEKYYDNKISLKIIGYKIPIYSVPEYVVYIPDYDLCTLNSNIVVTSALIKEYCIDPRFLGDHMTYIRDKHICSIKHKVDGAQCVNCNEWVELAAPNQPDGKTFICRACKENPWR